MNRLLKFELDLVNHLGWPLWACRSIEILVVIAVILSLLQVSREHPKSDDKIVDPKLMTEFRWFQAQYLIVFLIIMLADWLQGTNMYTLYSVIIYFQSF